MSDRLLTANLLSLSRAQGDGKGWGMGMGKGGCGDSCCKGEHKTPEGKQSWQASICTTITEAIGLVVTCFCSGTICCHLGCCMCCTVFISGIANLVGSSVPACCKSNKCNNIVFGTTGTISFVIRLIALIIFSASLHQWQSDLDDSDACKSKCGSSASANTPTPAPTTWYEKTDYKSCGDVCEEKCFLEECKINREVVKGGALVDHRHHRHLDDRLAHQPRRGLPRVQEGGRRGGPREGGRRRERGRGAGAARHPRGRGRGPDGGRR